MSADAIQAYLQEHNKTQFIVVDTSALDSLCDFPNGELIMRTSDSKSDYDEGLIDEFDKHLHPKWQSQLVAKLANTFPKVQFIMTTHNPMSILDREPNEITIIKEIDGEVTAVRGKGTKTMDVSTVLLEYFGVESTSKK